MHTIINSYLCGMLITFHAICTLSRYNCMPHQKVVLGATSPGEGASQNRVITRLSDLSVCVAPAYVDYNLSDEIAEIFGCIYISYIHNYIEAGIEIACVGT